MKVLEVIESKAWINKITGQRASIYGAVPYTNEVDKQNWSLVVVGYTWRLDNGTVGLGRIPAKTREEAEEVMRQVNHICSNVTK